MRNRSEADSAAPAAGRADAIEELLDFGLSTSASELPDAVVERTKLAILDTIGAALAAVRGEGVPALADLLHEWGGAPQATELVGGRRLPMVFATHINATAGRAWDLDDVHEQNTCHVNVNTVPAALALAEGRGPIAGRDLLAGIAVGSELMCRVTDAPRIGFSETGSAMSYQCGFYGAALTAARLLRLSKDRARHALGIAHAQVAGNHQGYVDGAMTVRLMQGIAAEGGLRAALMAERGLTGSAAVLEGRFGYYNVYHRGRYDREAILDGLGRRWLIHDISIKPLYACCKYTHAPIDAAIAAARELAAAPDEIERVTIRVTNKEVHDLVCTTRERKWNPQSVTDAQFSLPYTVASAIVRGRVDLDTFQPAGMCDARARALLARIEVDLDLSAQGEGRGTFPMPGIVTLRARNGKSAHARVDYVKGHPKNPMSFDDVAEKFRACAEFGRPGWNGAQAIVDAVRDLERLGDAGQIARLCVQGI